jgi:aminopeptidase N
MSSIHVTRSFTTVCARLGLGASLGAALLSAAACRSTDASAPPPAVGGVNIAPMRPLAVREPPFDVEHYAIRLDLDPKLRSIRACCTVRVWPKTAPLADVVLDLEGLTVSTVKDGTGRTLEWTHADGLLSIHLHEPVARGDFAEVAVEYGGAPQKGLWFTRIRDGGATQVFTHGECRDARWWFPCVDEPFERATSEISVTMPAGWTAVAAGERIERSVTGDRAHETWRAEFPHPSYLETLVCGELAVENDEWSEIPLSFAAAPEFRAGLRATFSETDEILACFSDITGARYPYPKYAQCCVDNFPFGGMENVSATTLIDTTIPDERGTPDSEPYGLIAHEAAHQWFGDLVTCKNWSEVWLNEGFATYFAALYTEKSRGAEAFQREMRRTLDAYLGSDVGANRRPVVYGLCRDPLELFFTGHVYQGGAVRLHHLRSVLGDDVFFRGVKAYLARHRGTAVTTDDLRESMEFAAGRDLRWFFEQWFSKPGFPEVSAAWDFDEGKHEVELELEQTQDSGNGTPAVFRLPIDVEIRDSKGSRIERVLLDRRRTSFEFVALEKPEWVRVDPHGNVPMRLDERRSEREWIAIASTCADADGRECAVRVLARTLRETKDPAEREGLAGVLLERLGSEASSDVRATLSSALAGIRTPSVRSKLQEIAGRDVDRGARMAALDALRTFGPDAELAAFALERFEKSASWNEMGSCAGLFSAAAPERAVDWLMAQLATPSAHGVWRARVLTELALRHDPHTTAVLRRYLVDANEDDAVRIVAAHELTSAARMDAEVRAELVALLDCDRFRLRREVIGALGALRDPALRTALERRWAKTPFETERRAIERALARSSSDA